MTNSDVREYVSEHREDLQYALLEGDRWTRTIVLAALVAAGDAELKLAKQELEEAIQEDDS